MPLTLLPGGPHSKSLQDPAGISQALRSSWPWVLIFQSCSGFQLCEQALPGHFCRDRFPFTCAHTCSPGALLFIIDSVTHQTRRPKGLCCSGGLRITHTLPLSTTPRNCPSHWGCVMVRVNCQLNRNWDQAFKHTPKRSSKSQVASEKAWEALSLLGWWAGGERPTALGRPVPWAGDPGLYKGKGE